MKSVKIKSYTYNRLLVIALALVFLYGFNINSLPGNSIPNPIIEQIASDLQGITISITYDTGFAYSPYNVRHGQDTGSFTNQNLNSPVGFDKDLIHFPCTGESVDKYVIPQNRISTVIKTKYNMGIYDRTDFIFTEDSLYVVNTIQNE